MKKTTFLLLTLLALASCVEEFKISKTVLEKYDSELVIQGRILSDGNSVIYISTTSSFGDKDGKSKSIRNAKVCIIGQNGYESDIAQYNSQKEQYVINTGNLEPNTRYAVKVVWDGETYQSEFQELQTSPEIDEVTYKERSDGISIHVSTHDAEDGRRAYMWTYEEDWEFHADIDFVNTAIVRVLYNKNIYPVNGNNNPYYYCWGHQKSGNIYIYSTDNLKENAVKEHELYRIPIDDIRIQYIYSVLVKQWSLNDEAYNYFKTLKLYTENTGGLFAPLPAEIDGNVKCVSNPDIKVRGYVLAATVVEKRIFIYEKDFNHIRTEYENCMWLTPGGYKGWEKSWQDNMDAGRAIIFTETGKIDETARYYHKECFDCRETKGSTKKRPDFWPNNHE